MAETVYVLCDNGAVMLHDLPLPPGIADRISKGQLSLVNEDGSPIVAASPEPPAADPVAAAPAKKATKAAAASAASTTAP